MRSRSFQKEPTGGGAEPTAAVEEEEEDVAAAVVVGACIISDCDGAMVTCSLSSAIGLVKSGAKDGSTDGVTSDVVSVCLGLVGALDSADTIPDMGEGGPDAISAGVNHPLPLVRLPRVPKLKPKPLERRYCGWGLFVCDGAIDVHGDSAGDWKLLTTVEVGSIEIDGRE